MFSFHKPKIYRSISGCCICKAKSSSSRFTDSKKYESEFEKCFKIIEKRSGEICNACVLLVKRWKKLPTNTTRDWHHVVDARAGPGTKSIKSKHSSINDNAIGGTNSSLHRKPQPNSHRKLLKPKTANDCNNRVDDNSNELTQVQSQIPTPEASDSSDSDEDLEEDMDDLEEEMELQKITKKGMESTGQLSTGSLVRDSCKASKSIGSERNKACDSPPNPAITSFLDMSFWKKEKICCGVIFKGPDNEVLIYPKLLEPCYCRRNRSSVDLLKPKLSAIVNGGSDTGSVGSSSLIEDDANSNASSGNISLI